MSKENLTIWEVVRISSGLGLTIALPISGGTIFGFILDKNLNTGPILTLIFLVGGIFVAFFGVARKIKELN
ncbi:MAG: AtpZ/AtpI family protein [bacterium]|nr:AtpZ/AtpI family protein [bacterium]